MRLQWKIKSEETCSGEEERERYHEYEDIEYEISFHERFFAVFDEHLEAIQDDEHKRCYLRVEADDEHKASDYLDQTNDSCTQLAGTRHAEHLEDDFPAALFFGQLEIAEVDKNESKCNAQDKRSEQSVGEKRWKWIKHINMLA